MDVAAGLNPPHFPHRLLHFHPSRPSTGLHLSGLDYCCGHLPSLPIPTHQVSCFFFPDPKPLLIVPFPYLMNSYSSFKTLSLQSNVQPTSNRSQDLEAYRAQSMSGDSPPSPRPTLPAGLGRDPWTPCERAGPIPEQPLALPNLPDSGRDPASTKCSEPTILHC